jgi:hypothetical protein
MAISKWQLAIGQIAGSYVIAGFARRVFVLISSGALLALVLH